MKNNQRGFTHPLVLVIVIVAIAAVGFAGYRVINSHKQNSSTQGTSNQNSTFSANGNLGDPNSLNPTTKGESLSNGQCSGTGSKPLTHAPMNASDISDIQPMGLMVGSHVTPVDHEYYWGKNQSAPINTYPVYADGDGTIVAVEATPNGNYDNWWVTIAHSCTFLSNYNLMTSITPSIKAALPKSWGPNSNGGVHIPVKAGELIGYVGDQSLDFQVWNTQVTLKGFLNPRAYNNREPWKVNTVAPLDYFTSAVKAQITPLYVRTVAPPDGKIDYDINGEAVGNWFLRRN